MGKKKDRWLTKYSPNKHKGENLAEKIQGMRLRRRRLLSQTTLKRVDEIITDQNITEEIYGIVCKADFESEMCNRVSKHLLRRLKHNPTISLGIIKNFKIPVKYVRPIDYGGDLTIGNNFGIFLRPLHKRNYIILLKDETYGPAVLVGREREGFLVGAVNFLSYGNLELNYPSILYDPQKIESLFNIGCINPYEPSANYKKI